MPIQHQTENPRVSSLKRSVTSWNLPTYQEALPHMKPHCFGGKSLHPVAQFWIMPGLADSLLGSLDGFIFMSNRERRFRCSNCCGFGPETSGTAHDGIAQAAAVPLPLPAPPPPVWRLDPPAESPNSPSGHLLNDRFYYAP